MIRERRPGVYEVVVFAGRDPITGRERRVSRTVHGTPGLKRPPKQARDLEARLQLEVGTRGESPALTVSELLHRWLEHATPNLSPTTVYGYRNVIDRYLRPRVGQVRLAKVTTSTLDRLYGDLSASGGEGGARLAPATVRQAHAVLRRALEQAVKWGWLSVNPAANATPPSVGRSSRALPEPAAVKRLLAACEAHDPTLGLLAWLAVVTGARRGELCGMRWADLDGDTVTISRSVVEISHRLIVKDPKNATSARSVALSAKMVERLRTQRVRQAEIALACGVTLSPDAYVLSEEPSGETPLHPNIASDRFRVLARRVKVPCRLHDLRHFAVTEALAAGVPVNDVAARAGHASSKMTLDVYGHARRRGDAAAAEAIETALG